MPRFYTPTDKSSVARINCGVVAQQSNIPGAGYGLFASRPFQKNEYISYYDGIEITRREALELRLKGQDSHVRSTSLLGLCVNGYTGQNIPDLAGAASLANHRTRADGANTRLENKNGICWLRANCNIQPGDELTCDYGRGYWQHRQGQTKV